MTIPAVSGYFFGSAIIVIILIMFACLLRAIRGPEIADRIGIMYAGELVEEGEVHEIFRNPVHPYSQALLAALPKIKKSEGTIRTIEGTVPRILENKPECRFANRCPYADETCRCSSPEAKFIADGHMVRCHKR